MSRLYTWLRVSNVPVWVALLSLSVGLLVGAAVGYTVKPNNSQILVQQATCDASWLTAQMQVNVDDNTMSLEGPDVRHEAHTWGLLYHYVQSTGPAIWEALEWRDYSDGRNIWVIPASVQERHPKWATARWTVDLCWHGSYPGAVPGTSSN